MLGKLRWQPGGRLLTNSGAGQWWAAILQGVVGNVFVTEHLWLLCPISWYLLQWCCLPLSCKCHNSPLYSPAALDHK